MAQMSKVACVAGGTSYRSGSDKQTYYKLSVSGDTPDSPMEMARSLFDGGSMDGDLAYIESLYSLPAFYYLVENRVPFPRNSHGAFVGYKTDHDPRQRATSAGPRTSRYMVQTSLSPGALILDDGEGYEEVQSAQDKEITYRKERMEDRLRRVRVEYRHARPSWEEVKPLPQDDSWFETVWAEWRRKNG